MLRSNLADNVRFATDPAGNWTSYLPDALGRTLTESSLLGQRDYRYDASGQVVWQRDRDGRERTFEYDLLGRLRRENWLGAGARTLAYDYDRQGNLSLAYDPDSRVAYEDYSAALGRPGVITTGTPFGAPQVTLRKRYDTFVLPYGLSDVTTVAVGGAYDHTAVAAYGS